MPSTHTGWFWTLSKQNLQVFIHNKEICSNQGRATELLHKNTIPIGIHGTKGIFTYTNLPYSKKTTIHVGINISVLRVVLGLKGNFVGLIPPLPGKPGTPRMIIICSIRDPYQTLPRIYARWVLDPNHKVLKRNFRSYFWGIGYLEDHLN